MKQLMFMRVNGHLFWRKRQISVSKYFTNQCRNHFSVVKTVQPLNNLPKPILSPKKLENNALLKKFSTDFQNLNRNNLMDFDVWFNPSFLTLVRIMYYYFFKIKRIDQSFSIEEFVCNSSTALQVVVNLLSELRFSELEGLLTPECKEEVERNIKLWPENELSTLAFKLEQVCTAAPGDIAIFSGEKNKEKLFIEIRTIHHIYLKSLERPVGSDMHPKSNTFLPKTAHLYGFFNTKFIREYTEGVNDQWTINAINVKFHTFTSYHKYDLFR